MNSKNRIWASIVPGSTFITAFWLTVMIATAVFGSGRFLLAIILDAVIFLLNLYSWYMQQEASIKRGD